MPDLSPLDLVLLVGGTALLAGLSRKALAVPGSHGFYRFFAWEGILLLFVRNRVPWGESPFSWHQLLSWPLLVASIALVLAGILTLRRHGAASGERKGGLPHDALYDWEKTTRVIDTGIFGYIRHPMYASLLALTWGAFFQDPGLSGLPPALVSSLALWFTARADEAECLAYFGPAYRDYMARTRRFVPGVI